MKQIETAPHEFAANYLFSENDLRPWFALDSVVKDSEGSKRASFDYQGDSYSVSLSYQEGGLAPPSDGETPGGSTIEHETIREFRLHVTREDCPTDDSGNPLAKVNYHVSPRWLGLRSKSGKQINTPQSFGDGINVSAKGANLPPEDYVDLLRLAAASVGVNRSYFSKDQLHPSSNIRDAERYVRIDRSRSGKVHGRDGPIARMGHLLESDRDGYRKLVQNDRDNQGKTLEGFYHTATIGAARVRTAFPDHEIPREIKHYYAKHANSLNKSHPLAHPKLGVSYQANLWDDNLHPVEDLDKLERELHQSVVSILAEADLPTRANQSVFVSDAFFSADTERESETPPVPLRLDAIEKEQESVVVQRLAHGLSPIQWDSINVLVSDGGQVSPDDIAESGDWHPDSVRRALRDMDEMIQREYGKVSLSSPHVAELLHEAVEEARSAVKASVETAARAKQMAEDSVERQTQELLAWASRHGVEIDERDAQLQIRITHKAGKDWRELIRDGYTQWRKADRDPDRYKQAKVVHKEDGYKTVDKARSAFNRGGTLC